jgi:ribonucleoside-diphosphate reductase alpha chain
MLKIEYLEKEIPVYDITVEETHNFFANDILVHNCCEITLKTKPIQRLDDENGRIALCILKALNVGKIKSDEELEELCDLCVRTLDELIDYQSYPVKAAEISAKQGRTLGVGIIGLAHYLAKLGFKYEQPEAWSAVHGLAESIQYYLLKASNQLAKEKGACEDFYSTKYSEGILPIDTYKKEVDEICNDAYQHDWEQLRENIKQYGLRNTTLTCIMPSESSSITSNATNGIEPPRGYLSIKKSKKGPIKQIVPQYNSLKNHYTLLWDMKSNEGYFNIVAVIQKFFDQAISANWNYNPEHYVNNEVPMSSIAQDFLLQYRLGHKTAYYQNTYDGKGDQPQESSVNEIQSLIDDIMDSDEEACDSCTI